MKTNKSQTLINFFIIELAYHCTPNIRHESTSSRDGLFVEDIVYCGVRASRVVEG